MKIRSLSALPALCLALAFVPGAYAAVAHKRQTADAAQRLKLL